MTNSKTMPSSRKLAAVMFTDIAGYTALMQKSERAAIETRRRHRAIFEPTTSEYGGQIIQYYGDGTLSIFDSTVAAVRCACALQRQFRKEPAIPVRIGIHTGDIVLTEDDIIGDSVNLASRVESLGVPGSVLVSGKVAEEVRNQEDLPLERLGTFHFKNDSKVREIFAVASPDLVVPQRRDMQGKVQPTKATEKIIPRILLILLPLLLAGGVWWLSSQLLSDQSLETLAVLPFFNRLNDIEQDHLVAGVHEALISELQQAGIGVKARTSMLQYRQTEKSAAVIANELGVQGLIEGSLFRADDTIGIHIQLIDGRTEDLLWSRSFEAGFREIAALYRDMTREIAGEIHQALTPRVEARMQEIRPVNPEAYKAYLKGQQYWHQLTPQGLNTALEYFELAREIDPDYAPAYAGIAAVWGGRLQQGLVAYEEAKPHLQRAMAQAERLGEDLPEVQFWKGTLNTWWNWEWQKAAEGFTKSLALNPNYAESYAYYSHHLLILHRSPEEALGHIRKALDLDPFNPLFQALYGMALNNSGYHEEAIRLLSETLRRSPTDPVALSTLRTSYHLSGQYAEAIEIWKRFYRARNDSIAVSTLERTYAEGGYQLALERLAEMLIDRSQVRYVTPWQIATLYTRAGRTAKALEWLEKAYESHDANMPYISIDPIFEDLRDEPRFQALLKRMKLPSEQLVG